MTHLRFSLAGLMAAVLLIGVGFAALRFASALWASALFTLAVASVPAATLGAAFSNGATRAFWAGCALFGVCYLFLILLGEANRLATANLLSYLYPVMRRSEPLSRPSDPQTIVVLAGWDGRTLVNGKAVADDGLPDEFARLGAQGRLQNVVLYTDPEVTDDRVERIRRAASSSQLRLSMILSPTFVPRQTHFTHVGQSLAALFSALIGGLLARYFYAKGRKAGEQT